MKICIIGPVPPFRGAVPKYCYALAKELEKKHELLILSYKRQYPQFLYRKNQYDTDSTYDCMKSEFAHVYYDLDSVNIFSWYATVKKIAEFNPDSVIIPWYIVFFAPMCLYLLYSLKKINIKVLFIGINVFEHEDNYIKKLLVKFVFRRVDNVLVHSELEKNEVQEINSKAFVAKHLLPLFEYEARGTTSHDSTTHLLFFGRVRNYKGLDTLLKAVSLLKGQDIFLKIVGEFWHCKKEYVTLIHDLGIGDKVEIIDSYISDSEVGQYFSWADLVVLPYKKTKTSGIIATAYGFGKPVLATNVGGFYEVVEDERTGKIVLPDDPASFADGLLWFLNNRDINFEDNIFAFVSQNMSWSSMVTAIEDVITHPGQA
jgi:glycosyltransferase involved in cell wall biosynthesis